MCRGRGEEKEGMGGEEGIRRGRREAMARGRTDLREHLAALIAHEGRHVVPFPVEPLQLRGQGLRPPGIRRHDVAVHPRRPPRRHLRRQPRRDPRRAGSFRAVHGLCGGGG